MILGDYTVSCIFAEFVRNEKGDRDTIIGTYSRHIGVPQLPAAIPVSFYVIISPVPPQDSKISFKARFGDEVLFEVNAVPPIMKKEDDLDQMTVAMSGGVLNAKKEDNFELILGIGDTEPKAIGRFSVHLQDEEAEGVSAGRVQS